MKRLARTALCSMLTAIILACVCAGAVADSISGRATVIDGDSLRIEKIEIRLHGIDAPEFRQTCHIDGTPWACGRSAAKALGEILGTSIVRCDWDERDSYSRVLATCYVDGANVNAKLVAHGLALAYTRYSDRYEREQRMAMDRHAGLWQGEFDPPWKWRRAHGRRSR
jgi:endonuclease YncB( thermonuclease family)